MRRSIIPVLTLALAACSSGASTTTTEVVSSTSTSSAPQTLVPGGLVPVDPPTLVPYEDAEPIVVGSSHRGTVSPSGEWLAIASDGATGMQVSIVDLTDLEVVDQAPGSGDGLDVGDGGLAAWFDEGRLRGLGAGIEWEDVALPGPVPSGLSESLRIFDDGRVGYVTGPDDTPGPITIVLADGSSVSEIVIDDVAAGPMPPADGPTPDFLAPAVVWDETRNRAILVSATANEIVVVDLGTGESSAHVFEAEEPPEWGAGRDVFLTTDGSRLLIATRIVQFEVDGGDWETHVYAADLVIVDTGDWASTVTTQSIWDLAPNRDGSLVAGTGASIKQSPNTDTETLQSPVYLIDGSDGTVLVGFEARSGMVADTQFSADGAEMYVITESDEGTNIDIVDVATQELAGSLGFNRIALIGEAGLIAFHLE